MVEAAVESFGGLDVLQSNASDAATNQLDKDIASLDMTVFDRLVAVNLKRPVHGVQARDPADARAGRRLDRVHGVDRGVRRARRPGRLWSIKGGCRAPYE